MKRQPLPRTIPLYLLRQLLLALLLTVGVLALIIWFAQALRLLPLVIDSGAGLVMFFRLLLLTLPGFLMVVLPLCLLLAVLMVFFRLRQDSELPVLQAVGMGPLQLAGPVGIIALLVLLATAGLLLEIAPRAERELVRLQYQLRNDYAALLLRAGVFVPLGDHMTFFARSRRGAELQDIMLYDNRQADAPVILLAERGQLTERPGEPPGLIVFDGMRQELERATGGLSQLNFASYSVDLSSLQRAGTDRWVEPRERTWSELLQTRPADAAPYLQSRLRADLHQRLALLLLPLGLSMMGLMAALGQRYSRRGGSWRYALTLGLGLGLITGTLGLASLLAENPWLTPALYVFVSLPLLAGIVWLAGHWRGHTS